MNAHHTITVFVASLVNLSLREDVMIHLRRQSSRRWQLVLLKKHTNVTYWGIEISTLCHFYCYSPRLCHRCNFDRSAMSSNPYLICEVSYLIFPSIYRYRDFSFSYSHTLQHCDIILSFHSVTCQHAKDQT